MLMEQSDFESKGNVSENNDSLESSETDTDDESDDSSDTDFNHGSSIDSGMYKILLEIFYLFSSHKTVSKTLH